MFTTASSLRLLAAAISLGTIAMHSSQASALSMSVQMACASDYYALCSQHDPFGSGVRACMRANGLKLSNGCVIALIGAGEISKGEVDRRRAEAK